MRANSHFFAIAVCASLLTGLLTGCGKTVQFGLAGSSQSFKQNSGVYSNQLDILWVIDNSPSMQPLTNTLLANFNSAINMFQSKGYDFHMAVTTTDAYLSGAKFKNDVNWAKFRDGTDATSHTGVFVILPTTPNLANTFVINANQGQQGSGDERAFSSFRNALQDPLNTGFLRVGGWLAVIILSDEDDFSGDNRCEYCAVDHDYTASTLDTVASYEAMLDNVTQSTGAFRRYNVSSIAVLDSACQQQHAASSPSTIVGQRYIQLAAATKGVTGSVCDPTYATSLAAISNQIAILSTQFYLNNTPDPKSIVVVVNGVVVPEDPNNGWTYDSTANSILFHGTAIPPQGANIGVNFQPTGVAH